MDENVHIGLRFAYIGHNVMDVPNKWPLEEFLKTIRRPKTHRIATMLLPRFQLDFTPQSRMDALSHVEQTLLDANDEMGRVWLPPGRHVLGAEAARLLRPHLLGAAVRPHDRRLGLPFLE
ncbi:unnamed protein product [Symbiodinium necroappetens]|uniref:Uncharacterized protein n=1 Tax=Symbiodinium necroappetens TaxID=1628268 RepID=A0A813BKU1_9DINO|nr:unnamed protein product [Symbiodinium necroappetens]